MVAKRYSLTVRIQSAAFDWLKLIQRYTMNIRTSLHTPASREPLLCPKLIEKPIFILIVHAIAGKRWLLICLIISYSCRRVDGWAGKMGENSAFNFRRTLRRWLPLINLGLETRRNAAFDWWIYQPIASCKTNCRFCGRVIQNEDSTNQNDANYSLINRRIAI